MRGCFDHTANSDPMLFTEHFYSFELTSLDGNDALEILVYHSVNFQKIANKITTIRKLV